MKKLIVLTADDSANDSLLFQCACRKTSVSFHLQLVNDGQHAIDYLSGSNGYEDRQLFPMPSLLMLDLKMPRKNGFEVLDWMREANAKNVPVVVFSSSDNERDIQQAYEKGANWYVMKPVDYAELLTIANTINEYLATTDASPLAQLQNFRHSPRRID